MLNFIITLCALINGKTSDILFWVCWIYFSWLITAPLDFWFTLRFCFLVFSGIQFR
ncbi:hypothetical protein HanPSC8_Chr15g0683901 [Helianthus annuus]|nr:hypothetical protein HanPSC8_Chr15g0683901 [Helianthus annuus]